MAIVGPKASGSNADAYSAFRLLECKRIFKDGYEESELRAAYVFLGLIVSAVGLLGMLATRNQWLVTLIFIAGVCLFYSGAFALERKSKKVLARDR